MKWLVATQTAREESRCTTYRTGNAPSQTMSTAGIVGMLGTMMHFSTCFKEVQNVQQNCLHRRKLWQGIQEQPTPPHHSPSQCVHQHRGSSSNPLWNLYIRVIKQHLSWKCFTKNDRNAWKQTLQISYPINCNAFIATCSWQWKSPQHDDWLPAVPASETSWLGFSSRQQYSASGTLAGSSQIHPSLI